MPSAPSTNTELDLILAQLRECLNEAHDAIVDAGNEISVLRALVRHCACGEPTRWDAPLCESCCEKRYTEAVSWPLTFTDVPF